LNRWQDRLARGVIVDGDEVGQQRAGRADQLGGLGWLPWHAPRQASY